MIPPSAMHLEDNDGYPWTAYLSREWLVILAIITADLGNLAVGLYLSFWLWTKRRSALPLVTFALMTPGVTACLALEHWWPRSLATNITEWFTTALYIASAFLLRREVQSYYQQTRGWRPIINPFLTLFFSAMYVNYCLAPDRIPVESPITSLDLPTPASAKINK